MTLLQAIRTLRNPAAGPIRSLHRVYPTPTLIRRMAPEQHPLESEIRPAFTYPADPVAGKAYVDRENAVVAHAKGSGQLWGKICIFIVAPVIALTTYHVWTVESAHFEHLAAHPRKPSDELPPEFDYQNVRNSRFFWGDGDKTLFWNDKYNHKKED